MFRLALACELPVLHLPGSTRVRSSLGEAYVLCAYYKSPIPDKGLLKMNAARQQRDDLVYAPRYASRAAITFCRSALNVSKVGRTLRVSRGWECEAM